MTPPDWLPDWASDQFTTLAAEIEQAKGDDSTMIEACESLTGHLACLQATWPKLGPQARAEVKGMRERLGLAPEFGHVSE